MIHLYGMVTLLGFMGTMFYYVLADVEVTKPELVATLIAWMALEAVLYGIRRFLHHRWHKKSGQGNSLSEWDTGISKVI